MKRFRFVILSAVAFRVRGRKSEFSPLSAEPSGPRAVLDSVMENREVLPAALAIRISDDSGSSMVTPFAVAGAEANSMH